MTQRDRVEIASALESAHDMYKKLEGIIKNLEERCSNDKEDETDEYRSSIISGSVEEMEKSDNRIAKKFGDDAAPSGDGDRSSQYKEAKPDDMPSDGVAVTMPIPLRVVVLERYVGCDDAGRLTYTAVTGGGDSCTVIISPKKSSCVSEEEKKKCVDNLKNGLKREIAKSFIPDDEKNKLVDTFTGRESRRVNNYIDKIRDKSTLDEIYEKIMMKYYEVRGIPPTDFEYAPKPGSDPEHPTGFVN